MNPRSFLQALSQLMIDTVQYWLGRMPQIERFMFLPHALEQVSISIPIRSYEIH